MGTYFLAPTQNHLQKTLSGGISDSTGTITLNNTTNLLAPGYVVIDRENSQGTATPDAREVVYYTGISGSDLTGCIRGADNSTARTHSDGAIVETFPSVGMWNNLATITSTAIDSNGYLKAIPSPVSVARMQITQEAISSIASIARAEIGTLVVGNIPSLAVSSIASLTHVQVSTLAVSSVASMARAETKVLSFVSTASVAIAEFELRNQDGNLSIRAGATGVLATPILEQVNTTDTHRENVITLTGWGTFQVNNGASTGSDTVTFGVTFKTKPIVVLNMVGSVVGAVTDIGSFTTSASGVGFSQAMYPNSITTTGFGVSIKFSSNVGADTQIGYAWVAIGQL